MKLRTIEFYLKEGAVSLLKNRLMTLASIATIGCCVFLFIISYCSIANVNFLLRQVESTVGITVFPYEDMSERHLEEFHRQLLAVDNVAAVRYISPGDALESMRADMFEETDLLELFEDDNPLPKSFEVNIANANNARQVIRDMERLEGTRKIRQAEEIVNTLINLSNALSIIGVVIVTILSAISIVIVMNTIKLTVYVRRKEINIMKYVGATDWFIRWPFIIEGVFIGILGAALPVAVGWASYAKIIDMISNMPLITGFFSLLTPLDLFPLIAPICLLGGGLLGMSGSIYSVRKHLNV